MTYGSWDLNTLNSMTNKVWVWIQLCPFLDKAIFLTLAIYQALYKRLGHSSRGDRRSPFISFAFLTLPCHQLELELTGPSSRQHRAGPSQWQWNRSQLLQKAAVVLEALGPAALTKRMRSGVCNWAQCCQTISFGWNCLQWYQPQGGHANWLWAFALNFPILHQMQQTKLVYANHRLKAQPRPKNAGSTGPGPSPPWLELVYDSTPPRKPRIYPHPELFQKFKDHNPKGSVTGIQATHNISFLLACVLSISYRCSLKKSPRAFLSKMQLRRTAFLSGCGKD